VADIQQEYENPLEEDQQYENPLQSEGGPVQTPIYSDTEVALRKSLLHEDRVGAFLEAQSKGHVQTNIEMMDSGADLANKALAEAVEATTIETGRPVDPEVIRQIQQEDDFFSRETGPVRAWLGQTENWESIEPDQQEEIVARRYIQEQISKIWDEMSISDVAIDAAGLVLLSDETWNSVSFTNKVLGTKTSVENTMNSADVIIKLGQAFQRLTPEEQVVMFQEMKKAAKDVDDNEIQQMFLLMAATGSTSLGEERFSQSVDKLIVAGTIGKVVSGLARGTRFLKDAASLREYSAVSQIADQAAKGTRPARELQTSRVDAASTVMPWTTGDFAKIVDQAPTEVASRVRDDWGRMDSMQEEALNFVQDNIKTVLKDTPGELEAATARAEAKVRIENPNIENLVIKDLDDGVQFEFDILERGLSPGIREVVTPGGTAIERVAGTEDVLTHKAQVIKFTEKDISSGFVNQDRVTTIEDMTSGVWSPNKMLKGERTLLVQAFERIANAQSKVRARLTDELRFAVGKLSPTSKGNLERVLFMGDRGVDNPGVGQVFSYQELVNDGVGGVKLSTDEYLSYARTRKVLDDMWVLKNQEVRQKAEARGAKLVNIGEQKGFPTVLDTVESARGRYGIEDDFKKVYDPLSKTTLSTISSEKMQEMYDKGFKLTKLENTAEFWTIDKAQFKWAFVRKEGVQELPFTMLNHKPGYVPRIYDEAYFFIKKADGQVQDGDKIHRIMKADRYFNNESDALTYRQQLIDKGADPDDVSLPLFDREPGSNPNLEDDVINIFGGLFASPRKSEPLKFGLDGGEAKLVEPLQAIQQYMFHLGNRMPVSQYRIGIQEKWMNDATDFLGKRPTGGFDLALAEVEALQHKDPRVKKFLAKAHEQISTLSGVPTKEEQRLQGKFVSIGKSLEERSPKLKGIASQMYSLSQKNPVNAAKAASYHMLLGTFSMAQYPIQALGATIAMSIDPVNAGKGMAKFFAFTQLDNLLDPSTKAAKLKAMSKIPGLGDIEDAHRLWVRSGYRESAMVTSGDFASIANGLPYDGNLLSRLFDKGAFFVKSGELVNMRISFATAFERWKSLNKGKALDDDALKEIFARSEQFRLNMGQGNRARFQKGVISIPTQFQQVNTKFLEALGPGSHFTPAERRRLVAGQGILFGAAGIPFGQQLVSYLADGMDADMSGMSPEEMNLVNRGVMGWGINNQLDIDAEVTGRVAIAGGVAQTMTDLIFEDHSIMGLAGPSGAVAERFWNGPIDVLIKAGKMVVNAEDVSAKHIGDMAENLAIAFADIPSSSRNLINAYLLWNSGAVRTSTGKVLYTEDPQLRDMLFRAVGFQSMKSQEFYDLATSQRAQQMTEKHMVDSLFKMYLRTGRLLDSGEEARAEGAAFTIAVLRSAVKDPVARQRIMNSVMKRARSDGELTELIEKALKKSNDWSTPSSQDFNILLQEAKTGEQ